MKLNRRKLKVADKEKNNVFKITSLYYLVCPSKEENTISSKKVIFWGTCFKQLSDDLNAEEYVRKVNLCLDYIRKYCQGYKLYYKPHPAEKDELKLLNLESFEMLEEPAAAEFFLWKNFNSIAYSFSVLSNASISAFDFGINSYVFYKLFKSAFGKPTFESLEDYFQGFPDTFFIDDLSRPLKENKITLVRDEKLESDMKEMLEEKEGEIWFNIVEPALALVAVSLAKLIKNISPQRKIHLLISKQHRWNAVNIKDIESVFDEIRFLPRVYYSLRPSKVWEAVRQAIKIKNLGIKKEDIIISFLNFPNFSFVENCLVSYFNKNKRIAFTSEINFNLLYALNFSDFFAEVDFKTKPANVFFNKILEPLLGLNKTIFLQYGDGRVFNITRYEKPLNDIFDRVYVLRSCPD